MCCACMAMMVTLILSHETLSLLFLLSPKPNLWHQIFTTSGVVGKKMARVCFISLTRQLCANAMASSTCGAPTLVVALFARVPRIVKPQVGSL